MLCAANKHTCAWRESKAVENKLSLCFLGPEEELENSQEEADHFFSHGHSSPVVCIHVHVVQDRIAKSRRAHLYLYDSLSAGRQKKPSLIHKHKSRSDSLSLSLSLSMWAISCSRRACKITPGSFIIAGVSLVAAPSSSSLTTNKTAAAFALSQLLLLLLLLCKELLLWWSVLSSGVRYINCVSPSRRGPLNVFIAPQT